MGRPRALAWALAGALLVLPAHAQLREPPKPTVARDGDSMGNAIVVTPSATKLGFVTPRVPSDAIAFPRGVIGLRFGTVLIVSAALEACAAWAYLNGPEPRFHGYLNFATVGDLDLRGASTLEILRITADAHKRLKMPADGYTLVCWNCTGPDVMSGLHAVGGKPIMAWEAQRLGL
jgi:hypothetical protein